MCTNLHGDWPVRDFADPGQPLTPLASAAAGWLFGPGLLTEVVLSITLLSLAAALTYVLAVRASGSLPIAVAAVGAELIAAPVQRRHDLRPLWRSGCNSPLNCARTTWSSARGDWMDGLSSGFPRSLRRPHPPRRRRVVRRTQSAD